ncbi:MAG: DUF3450 family protein [Verrucomicrobiota bacterium JB023]|nr:DUF3450 family protein [Verrucomicrobiota bacterium JB023]
MARLNRACAVVGISLAIGGLQGQTVAETHVELKTTIEQWMEQMQATQELESSWASRKDVLQDSIVGLKGMIEQAEVDIAEVEKRLAAVDETSREKLDQQEAYNAARDAFRSALPEVEAEVAKLQPIIPEFYYESEDGSPKLKAALEDLQAHITMEPDEKEDLGLNKRLQPLVQILSDAERFHTKIWAVKNRLRVGETDKNMNVLYMGLSYAYAVDDEGTVALRGYSDLSEGWVFEPMEGEDIASRVLDLYKSADGSGESQMVNLPLEIK